MRGLLLVVKWFLWKLGVIESGFRPLVEDDDPEIQPVRHDDPLFRVDWYRLGACDAKLGNNQWFTVFAKDAKGEPLAGVEIRWDIEWGDGVVADRPNWVGVTNERGVCQFMHTCRPTRYRLYADGELVLSNVRTDLNVDLYCNPYWDPGGKGVWGWVKINKPGFYGYHVYLTLKE